MVGCANFFLKKCFFFWYSLGRYTSLSGAYQFLPYPDPCPPGTELENSNAIECMNAAVLLRARWESFGQTYQTGINPGPFGHIVGNFLVNPGFPGVQPCPTRRCRCVYNQRMRNGFNLQGWVRHQSRPNQPPLPDYRAICRTCTFP